MHQFTHFLNHYSQSERLIRIERYVKTIINRGGELPHYWSDQQRLEYCNRTLWHLPKLLSFYEPDHEYSEHINAFWHACEKVGLLECGHLSLMAGQIIHTTMNSVSSIVEIESLIAEYAGSLGFRRQATDRRYQQQQKQQGLELDYYFREPNYIHTFGHEQFAPLVSNAGREVVQRDSRGFFLYCSTWLR